MGIPQRERDRIAIVSSAYNAAVSERAFTLYWEVIYYDKKVVDAHFFLCPIIGVCKIVIDVGEIVEVNDSIPRVHEGHSV